MILLPLVLALSADSSRIAGADSASDRQASDSAWSLRKDSSAVDASDSTRVYRMRTTVVKGERRFRRQDSVGRETWSKPSSMGLPGALEALRDRPGVAFSGDLTGHFSALGMPVEGSLVTWDGAPVLWPWHFGGLFGVLDDWAVGSLEWRDLSEGASPAHGGGWLATHSRAWGDSDEVHAGARLGFVAGGVAAWGRRGEFGWQVSARRTWLDKALEMAKDLDWTDQEMDVLFQDASVSGNWRHGPWSVSVGWFGSEDTLGIGLANRDAPLGISWRNIAVPIEVGWREGAWNLEWSGSWSRYRRFDSELPSKDTLVRERLAVRAEHVLDGGLVFEFGTSLDAYESGHWIDSAATDNGWFGDRDALVVQPHVGIRRRNRDGVLSIWSGVARTGHDAFAPQAGFAVSKSWGGWAVDVSGERRIVPLAMLDQSRGQLEAASPAWILVPDAAPRTTSIRASIAKRTGIGEGAASEARMTGWYRLHEGVLDWEPVADRISGDHRWEASSSDGWSSGLEIGGGIKTARLELDARQVLSMDVLRRRPEDGWTYPSRWAPWDQRWRTELRGSWIWIGPGALPGALVLESDLVCRMSSGVLRSKIASEMEGTETPGINSYNSVRARYRVPYFRLDITPVRIGRKGQWSAWWTLVNLTNEKNLLGWAEDGGERAKPISQIPFLPVVFGVQIEI